MDKNKVKDINWAAYATVMGCGILFLVAAIPGQTISNELLFAISVSTIVSAIIAFAEIVIQRLK